MEGNQLELRYSFGRHYNEIPLNPVLYLEWHPRHLAQDRAEVRLLLGGDAGSKFLWASNLFFEMNVDDYNASYAEGKDMEVGATVAGSYAAVGDVLRLGGELKAGGDMHGEPTLSPMVLVGPSALLKVRKLGLKLTATVFFGLMERDPRVQTLLIAGWAF